MAARDKRAAGRKFLPGATGQAIVCQCVVLPDRLLYFVPIVIGIERFEQLSKPAEIDERSTDLYFAREDLMGIDRRDLLTLGQPRSRDVIRGENRGPADLQDGVSQNAPVYARRSATDLTAYSGSWTWREAAHLLRRSMMGPTEAEIKQAVSDGMAATITKLMQSHSVDLTGIDEWAEGETFQIRGDSGQDQQVFQAQLFQRRDAFVIWSLRNAAKAPVSIQERLRFFWHNHFTSEVLVIRYPELLYQQWDLLAKNMLGNFKEFCNEITIDLGMLIYLDGIRNFKVGNSDNINENYSRELMELYTMGVFNDAGEENYSQEDVVEGARALSGWTYDLDPQEIRTAVHVPRLARFQPLMWDSGQKTLMTQTGSFNAEDVVDVLFEERAEEIARFMCRKLYSAFVYEIPDPVVIDQMANTFRSNNWEIQPVIEELLTSEHFYDVTNIGALHKGPIDYVVGMIRGTEMTNVPGVDLLDVRIARNLSQRLTSYGQLTYYPPNVKGWPGGRTWTSTSTLPIRQKFAIDVGAGTLSIGQQELYTIDPIAFARRFSDPYDIEILADEMARFLLNSVPSDEEATLLLETILDGGVDYEWDLDDPEQRPAERIRKFIQAVVKLAKYQLY